MLGIHVISPFYTRPDQWERESERKRERERAVSAELSLSSVSLFQEGIINQRAADMWRENTRRQKKFSRRRPRYGPGQQIKEGGGRKKRKRSGLHEKNNFSHKHKPSSRAAARAAAVRVSIRKKRR